MQLEIAMKLAGELERIVLARLESDRLVIPAMPAVAARALEILGDPSFQTRRLLSELEADPVLAALVLRQANQASHGGAVRLLEHAVARLGASALKSVIAEYAAHELFQSSDRRIVEANRRIWQHSVAVAVVSRDIATLARRGEADICYLGGLLHDVGKPVLASMMLEAERKLATGRAGWIDHASWVDVVAGGHRRIGTRVAHQWSLPTEVTAAIRDCAHFDRDEPRCAANIVRLANAAAKLHGFATGAIDRPELDGMVDTGCTLLGLDMAQFASVVDRLDARVARALDR